MSRIAQKLCDDIVEPALNRSRTKSSDKSSSKFIYNPGYEEPKTTRSIVIEKKKVINKLLRQGSGTCKNIKTEHSKEISFRKKCVDVGLNTYITGPLKCDNNCVTLVRRRENRCSCKVPQPHTTKVNTKQIQTHGWKNYTFTDKACSKCIETVNCSTQYYNTEAKLPNCSRAAIPLVKNIKPLQVMRESPKYVSRKFPSTLIRPSTLNHYYMGSKRWALSQYPTRGPDF